MPTSWQLSTGIISVRSPCWGRITRYSLTSPRKSRSRRSSMTAAPCSGWTTVSPLRNTKPPHLRGLGGESLARIARAIAFPQIKIAGQRAFLLRFRRLSRGNLFSRHPLSGPSERIGDVLHRRHVDAFGRLLGGGREDRCHAGASGGGEPLRHPRHPPDTTREAHLAHERGCIGRRAAGGRRRDGRHD